MIDVSYDPKDLTSMLIAINNITTRRKEFEEIEEELRIKIRNRLKELQWDRYRDDKSGLSATLLRVEKHTVDEGMIKEMLSEYQLSQVTRTTIIEKLTISNKEHKQRMGKNVKR
jgi:hypothetical protein